MLSHALLGCDICILCVYCPLSASHCLPNSLSFVCVDNVWVKLYSQNFSVGFWKKQRQQLQGLNLMELRGDTCRDTQNTSCNANTFKWWKCVFVCVHTYSVQSGRWTGVCVSAEGLAALWWKASTDWKRPPVSAQTSQIPHSTCLILYEGTASKQRGGQRDSREKDTDRESDKNR